MKVGLIGLPQTGKKTFFRLLREADGLEKSRDSKTYEVGTVGIQDPRLDVLAGKYPSKKKVRARIDLSLLPKIEKDTLTKGEIFK
jgi:ribosome-binding ATPase YchF (GTP1/OBG family)